MLLNLNDGRVLLLCVVGWAAWSLLIGFVGYKLPLKHLEIDTWLTQPRPWGETRKWYEQVLRIKDWKDWLPEAGNFFPGGFQKSSIGGGNYALMSRFVAETRRAEYVHIAIWFFWLVTILWTSGWGVVLNLVVGTTFNLPCLWVQRYNRLRLQHLLLLKKTRKITC